MNKKEYEFTLRYEIVHLRDFRDKFLPELKIERQPKIEQVIDLLIALLEQNLLEETSQKSTKDGINRDFRSNIKSFNSNSNMMKYSSYSHRHGQELLTLSHPEEYSEITSVLESLDPFPHGEVKNKTPKGYIAEAFEALGWDTETKIPLGTGKSDYCDLSKNSIFIEQEYSRFEMFFRDFFRFLLLHDERTLDIGVLITYDDSAFSRWGSGVSSYKAARASLGKLIDFLEGKYSAVVRVPIWCIGIE